MDRCDLQWRFVHASALRWAYVPLHHARIGKPYLHPRSPCPIYDWKGPEAASGTYFALIHNKFDFTKDYAYQDRGPLFLIAGRFNPAAKDQPIEFSEPKMFAPRTWGNSFYSSYTVHDGKGILWFNDLKFYLLGREIGSEWFDEGASATVDFTKPLGKSVRALNGGSIGVIPACGLDEEGFSTLLKCFIVEQDVPEKVVFAFFCIRIPADKDEIKLPGFRQPGENAGKDQQQ